MRVSRVFPKFLPAVLLLALAFSVGCSSRTAMRGESGSGPGGRGAAGGADMGGSAGVTSEAIRGEAGTRPVGPGGTAAGGVGGVGGAGGTGIGAAGDSQAGVQATREKASMFKDIFFEFDQSAIRDEDKSTLNGIASYLQKNPSKQLIIEGHCDARGTAEYNMALGERRAESARRYLLALGIKGGTLYTVSYGKEKPFDSADSEDAWAKNRRAHFLLK